MSNKFILKSPSEELVLPVTPQAFSVSDGNNIQKISIHNLGDVHLWGQPALSEIKLSSFFPKGDRSYALPGRFSDNPYGAIELIQKWMREKTIVRFIVSETPVNRPVMPSSLDYGEKDGTGDVYFDLVLSEYRSMRAVEMAELSSGSEREAENEPVTKEQSYEVQSGDTLWAIAQKYYGDGSLAYKLAEVNGIKNANLIYPGDNIVIPEKSIVQAATYTGARNPAPAPKVDYDPLTGKAEVRWAGNEYLEVLQKK